MNKKALVAAIAAMSALSSMELAQVERLDQMMNDALEKFGVPGAAVGIVVDGEVVLTRGYGFRDVEHFLPVTEETLFAIGSCSKAFTTFILGQLVDKKLISWDDLVIKHLPEFRLKDIHATHHLTIRDLVTHRSGLPRHDALWYGSKLSRSEILSKLQYLEPTADLREKFQYNNLSYLVAGVLIEKVTGKSWEQMVQENIFAPLVMNHSSCSLEGLTKTENFSFPYREKNEQIQKIAFKNIDIVGPAGSINSSVADMVKWLKLQLSNGQGLIEEATLRSMHVIQTAMAFSGMRDSPYEPTYLFGYSLGWMTGMHKGSYLVTHGGGIDGFISNIVLFPKEKVGVVVLTNVDSFPLAEKVSYAIADLVMNKEDTIWMDKAIQDKEKINAFKKEQEVIAVLNKEKFLIRPLTDYVGEYEHPGYGVIDVSLNENDGLLASYNGITYSLKHNCYDHFSASAPSYFDLQIPCSFVGNELGSISILHMTMEPALAPAQFKKIPSNIWRSESYLRKFAGLFETDPGVKVKIVFEKEGLVAIIAEQPPYDLVPEQESVFFIKGVPGCKIHFIVDGEDKILGAKLTQPYGSFELKVVKQEL